jgi:hypothetical protein
MSRKEHRLRKCESRMLRNARKEVAGDRKYREE